MMRQSYKYFLTAFLFTVLGLFPLLIQAKTSVWKVTKGNDHLFIGGTVHILPASEFPLPEAFSRAYQQSDSIVLETKLPDGTDTDLQVKMMQQMTYSDGQSIRALLSEETQREVSQYTSSLGADFSMFEHFKPGFLVTMLTILSARKAKLSGDGVDIFYRNKAIQDNKAIHYLESITFQMDMMATMGKGNEDSFIKTNIKQLADFKPTFLSLLKAWRTGDEKSLSLLAILPMKEDPKTYKQLLTDRNKAWIPQIEQMLSPQAKTSQKEFVLVGVAHLIGNDNVLMLLRNKGYQVEPW